MPCSIAFSLLFNLAYAINIHSTLVPAQLAEGQDVYQLLASPYQDLWLHWLDAGNDAYKQQAKDSNQERLDFVRSVVAAAAAAAVSAASQNGTAEHESLPPNGVEPARQVRLASCVAAKSEAAV